MNSKLYTKLQPGTRVQTFLGPATITMRYVDFLGRRDTYELKYDNDPEENQPIWPSWIGGFVYDQPQPLENDTEAG